MNRLVAFSLSLILVSSTLFATKEDSHAIRAAIDIGMAGPKLQVAEVDLKTNKIVKIMHTQRYFVNFYEGISGNNGNKLSDEVMTQGLEAFKNAVNIARSLGAEGIVAIATASFRSLTMLQQLFMH